MRVVLPGCEESGRGVLFGDEIEFTNRIAAKSHVELSKQLPSHGYGKPEVRTFLIATPTQEVTHQQNEVVAKTAETDSGYRAAPRSPRDDTAR